MKLTPLEFMETYVARTQEHSVNLAEYEPGIHCTPHVFFNKETDGSVPWVVNRVCDHAGGQLRLCENGEGKAVCPLHNWEFDFETLSYSKIPNDTFSVIKKKSVPYRVEGTTLTYTVDEQRLRVPLSVEASTAQTPVTLRYLAHASALLDIGGFKLFTDPWLMGECFATGWWLYHPPKADALELLAGADAVYISHNHPDHLHPETLSHVRRDVPVLVPKFDTDGVAKPLYDMGFTNVIELERRRLYRVNDSNVLVCILPTGDHRDDSGLFVTSGDFSAVLTVDCVGTNQYVLPENISLLMTCFASGSSGWPICYEVVGSLEERSKIVTKNRGTARTEVMKYLQVTKPQVYMPYAGFFEEKAPRDPVVKQYNIKNTPQALLEHVRGRFPEVSAVNPIEHDVVEWKDGKVSTRAMPPSALYEDNDAVRERYIAEQKALLKHFDIEEVARYFNQSEFRDDLIVYLALTDDDFRPDGPSLRIDFSTDPISHRVVDGAALLAEFEGLKDLGKDHHLLLKARRDSMWQIVYFGRPLEELSIGFQCRIDRKPDQYNAAFWKHYTTFGAPMLRRGEDRLLYKLLDGAVA